MGRLPNDRKYLLVKSQALWTARTFLGLTLQEVPDFDISYISKIENGLVNIGDSTFLKKIAIYELGASDYEILKEIYLNYEKIDLKKRKLMINYATAICLETALNNNEDSLSSLIVDKTNQEEFFDDKEIIGNILRIIRQLHKHYRRELGVLTGIDRRTIDDIENGEIDNNKNVISLLEVYSLTEHDLDILKIIFVDCYEKNYNDYLFRVIIKKKILEYILLKHDIEKEVYEIKKYVKKRLKTCS